MVGIVDALRLKAMNCIFHCGRIIRVHTVGLLQIQFGQRGAGGFGGGARRSGGGFGGGNGGGYGGGNGGGYGGGRY